MASQDQWKVSGDDRAKHDGQFFNLKPSNGFITGDQARGFFLQSGLPTQVLGHIWGLADINGDGKMDKKEFSIAMHLIKKKLQGYELPKVLPPSLKADPSPSMGSLGASPIHVGVAAPSGIIPQMAQGSGAATLPAGMSPSLVAPQSASLTMPRVTNGFGQPPFILPSTAGMGMGFGVNQNPGQFVETKPRSDSFGRQPAPPVLGHSAAGGAAGDWSMPHPSKLKYTQVFNSHDHHKRGHLTGVEARSLLMQSGLPQNTLAQVWTLADFDKDGKLTCEEFCIAMFMIDQSNAGRPLPATLPPELIPARIRAGSQTQPGVTFPPPQATQMAAFQHSQQPQATDAFGDLLGGFAPIPPTIPMATGDMKPEENALQMAATFEDKRKQNFDKGQAELEKRRQALQDQLRKEEEARVEKERREHEKREQQRMERERKKQYELEKQLEKQREVERQREEQRQKMLEQREAARREVERQRQMEWERQRREQLMAEKTRESEQLEQIKSHNTNLKNELEAMDAKKIEMTQKISQVRSSAAEVTSSIERMRQSRDLKLADIEQFHNSLQELSQKYQMYQKEHEQLALNAQTTLQNNPVYDMHRTVSNSIVTKKASIERLKQQLADIEKATAAKLADIDVSNTSLSELNQKVTDLEKQVKSSKQEAHLSATMDTRPSSTPILNGMLSAKEKPKVSWFDTNDISTTTVSTNSWGFESALSSTHETTNNTSSAWTADFDSFSAGPLVAHTKTFQALYQFDARNMDEMSLSPGDIVICDMDSKGTEPGWMYGECNGKYGCFPEAFVQETVAASTHTTTDVSSPTAIDWSNSFPSQTTNKDGSAVENNVDGRLAKEVTESSFIPVQTPTTPPKPMQGERAPLGLTAQALYPWKAKKDNHLTFNKGDIITVTIQQDMWWSGELNGLEGWFPKSYVKLISGPTNENSMETAADTQTPATQMADAPSQLLQYIAVYTYQSDEPNDLTFNQGEVIDVTGQDGDWWTGNIGSRSGMFPANYVKKMETQDIIDSPKDAVILTNNITNVDESSGDQKEIEAAFSEQALSLTSATQASADANNSIEPSLKVNKKPEIATVIATYAATGQEQLSLQPGQLIHVRRKNPSGWWQGELQARGQKKKIGWFPADYVKLLGSTSARSTPDMTRGASPALSLQQDLSRTATPSPVTLPPNLNTNDTLEQKYVDQVVALYPYTAQNSEELTFQKDSIINVISKDANWWVGEMNGSVGIFPSNYVQLLSNQQNDGTYQQVTTPEENKRQNAIQELIDTEEIYMSDMSIVLDVFYKPLSEKVLNRDELQAMFINWSELILCNTKLLKSLRVRKKMCRGYPGIQTIGDILCENLPHLSPYVRYCSCQLNAAALLQRKTETSQDFKDVHKKCVTDPRAKGLPLSSYLLKPMQRITKYPLIIKTILSHTPEDHSDHSNLVDALSKAEELCSQVNEGVREKENSDRLEWIQHHVQCDTLPEKVIFNSMTNCLGPRKLIYSATLYKAKSNKELVGFLFNDFLLLTQPIRPIGSVVQAFTIDIKSTNQYRMYKHPIFLNEVIVKHASDDDNDTNMFVILHIDRVYTLKAVSTNERDSWMKHIETCSRFYLETERKKRERAYTTEQTVGSVGRVLVIIAEGIGLKSNAGTVRRNTAGVGRLLIVMLEAKDLKISSDGKSDPYCEVSIGSQEHKTKVINGTTNPKWNSSMQFTIKDIHQDVLCITVYDRDLFTPNDFLGRTELRLAEIYQDTSSRKGPITKHLVLHEVECGEVLVKIDIQMFDE